MTGTGVSTTALPEARPTTTTPTGLTFAGLLRSEWIKLWSLRSTYWCFAIAVALTVGLGVLLAAVASVTHTTTDTTSVLVQSATAGTSLAELVLAVLGALVITGEYGTGMIRTTFLAAPRRLGALGAKALTFGLVAFALGILMVGVTAVVAALLLSSKGMHADSGAAGLWGALLGGAGAVALVGLMAVGIGMLVKNSAFAITLSVGILFVLPLIMSIISGLTQAQWAARTIDYLPSSVASRMASYDPHGTTGTLDPWQAALVMVGWAVVFLGLGMVVAERRDA